MSVSEQTPRPDFDEDFNSALTEWRDKHKIKDDDIILLLMDLFRIHQVHWDEIRHRQMPSLEAFKADIAVLAETTEILKKRASKEVRSVDLKAAVWAAVSAAVAGFLLGKLL